MIMEKVGNIQEIHHILLGFVMAFHQICIKNNITYCILVGTMLGAKTD